MRAFERLDERPAWLPLGSWLVRLADEVLAKSCRQATEESLDEQVEKPSTEPQESQQDSWVEWATFSETIDLGDTLPAPSGADIEEQLDREME